MSTTEHVSMTHTPGPWRCDRKHEECEVYYIDATTPDSPWPFEIAVLYSETDGAQLANARLIAASPELLDLVRRLAASDNAEVGLVRAARKIIRRIDG